MKEMISVTDSYLNIGGAEITAFGEEAIIFPSVEDLVKSKKGLDTVTWLRQNKASLELKVTVNILADSPSVKILKGFEKAGVIIPFYYEFKGLGVIVEALECHVREVGDLTINTEMPELSFEVTLKNFEEMKGL